LWLKNRWSSAATTALIITGGMSPRATGRLVSKRRKLAISTPLWS
jgi:hypothetical protein